MIQIIPDKICPHCGGDKWVVYKVNTKEYGIRTRYKCIVKSREAARKHYLKYPNEWKDFRQKQIENGTFYLNRHNLSKKQTENLSDGYIKRVVAANLNKKYKNVTSEEIEKKRTELIKLRERKKLPLKERNRLKSTRSKKRNQEWLGNDYIKAVIRTNLRLTNKPVPSLSDITEEQIIRKRASIIAFRKSKGKRSITYMKTCIVNAVAKSSKKISRNNVSKLKAEKYKTGLNKIRYMKELSKLLTI